MPSAVKGLLSKGREAAGRAAPIVAISALGLLTVAASHPAWAVTSVQPFTTTDTFTNFPAASSVSATYRPHLPQFTVQPFNAALGTLTSTTIVWGTTASFSGTVGAASASGNSSLSAGGSYAVDGVQYGGGGGGNGGGGNTGDTFSFNIASFGDTRQFLTSGAGVSYDPLILADFIGANPYSIVFEDSTTRISPYSFTYSNIASGSASFTTTASVTYDYVAAPSASVPGPLPLLGAGAAWGWSRRLRRRCSQRQG